MISFFDFIYKKTKLNYENKQIITNFAVQFSEKVENQEIVFEAYIKEIGELRDFLGHFEFEAKEEEYSDGSLDFPQINQKANFRIGKTEFLNGMPLLDKK